MRQWIILAMTVALMGMVVSAQATNARVITMWEMLNVRAEPARSASVVVEIAGRSAVNVLARTAANDWYQIQTTEGNVGWVAAGFIDLLTVSIDAIPIASANNPAPVTAPVEAEPVSAQATASGDGFVTAAMLNVRSLPSTRGAVLVRIPQYTSVTILGRNGTGTWLFIQIGATQGWVARAYISTSLDIASLPLSEAQTSAPVTTAPANSSAPTTAGGVPAFFTLGARSWDIFATGQALGNRASAFSKIGDSMTVAEGMYTPFAYGAYNLGAYGDLQATIDFFNRTNSFANVSQAANNGWTTASVLNPAFANPQVCQAGEAPLLCEYRVMRPAVALIMLGSNDVINLTPEQYSYNLRAIVQLSIDNGVIPVLSTIPPRRGFEDRTNFFNQLIIQVASDNGISLWDYGSVMRTLPDDGLSIDGLHPSPAPGGFANSANFTGDLLQFGYVQRNLTALQVLDTLRRQVLGG